jgi:DNA topoisomerase-1
MNALIDRATTHRADLLRDGRAAARAAHLHYVEPGEPGIRRLGKNGRFRYVDERGRVVRRPRTLARIRALVIPPAWQDVWICAREDGHLQATGFDVEGRKQYRYHAQWRSLRDRAKYEDILPFVRALPRLRRRVARDLARSEPSKEKMVALVVRLIEATQIRVGNEKYAQANGSHGVTTLRGRHARVHGETVEFVFPGKAGKRWRTTVRDRRLAAALRRASANRNQPLFRYRGADGATHPVRSADVNAYLRESMGQPFTAKEFRTWAATLQTSIRLSQCAPCQNQRAAKRNLARAIEEAASCLGNTVTVCRKSYIDPSVFDCYLAGRLHDEFARALRRARQSRSSGLSAEERVVSALLDSLRQRRHGQPHGAALASAA